MKAIRVIALVLLTCVSSAGYAAYTPKGRLTAMHGEWAMGCHADRDFCLTNVP